MFEWKEIVYKTLVDHQLKVEKGIENFKFLNSMSLSQSTVDSVY